MSMMSTGGPLPDPHGPANFFGDDHPAQVVDAADDSGCFHIQNLLGEFLVREVVFAGEAEAIRSGTDRVEP